MDPKAACEHRPGSWEVNDIAKYFTQRCARCGDILERISFTKAVGSKVRGIQLYLKKVLV